MTTEQFQADLAAAALRMSRSTPGVSLDVIHDAMIIGADMGMACVQEFWKANHEEIADYRRVTNLPN
jgi:hypothetical protein